MITKTKTYYVMDEQDIEKLASEYYKKDLKVGDLKVTFEDGLNEKPLKPIGAGIFIEIDESDEIFSLYDEIFCEYLNVEKATWDQTFVEDEYIFNFDTSKFKSYERITEKYE